MNADSFPPHCPGEAVSHIGGIDGPGWAWGLPPPGLQVGGLAARAWICWHGAALLRAGLCAGTPTRSPHGHPLAGCNFPVFYTRK